MKLRMTFVVALLLVTLSVMAYGAGKFVKTWKNPDAQPVNWNGKKVAAFVMTLLKDTREGAEQALARELTQRGAQGVPGHTVVPPEAEKDREAAKRILADAGITGVVLMRVVDAKQEMVETAGGSYYLGPSYSTFSGYWSYGWTVGYAPGVVGLKTTVMIETLAYSIDQDRLLWAGTSKTTDPKDIGKVIKKLVDAAGSEVKKAGLVGR